MANMSPDVKRAGQKKCQWTERRRWIGIEKWLSEFATARTRMISPRHSAKQGRTAWEVKRSRGQSAVLLANPHKVSLRPSLLTFTRGAVGIDPIQRLKGQKFSQVAFKLNFYWV